MSNVTNLIRGWWHVASAVGVCLWLILGWVQQVNASMDSVHTLERTTVRKDVQSEQLKRIEEQLQILNEHFEAHLEREHE